MVAIWAINKQNYWIKNESKNITRKQHHNEEVKYFAEIQNISVNKALNHFPININFLNQWELT